MARVPKPTSWLALEDQWIPRVQLPDNGTPNFVLPDNRKMIVMNKIAGYSNESLIGRGGVTACIWGEGSEALTALWIHGTVLANTGKQSSWGINEADWGGTFISNEDMVATADAVGSPGRPIEIDEFHQGSYAFSLGSTKPRVFYERRKLKNLEAGKTYLGIGSYGSPNVFNVDRWETLTGGTLLPPTDTFFKSKLQSQANARASCAHYTLYNDGLIGVNLKDVTTRLDYGCQYYQKKYAIEVHNKAMGKIGGIGPGLLMYVDHGKIQVPNTDLSGTLSEFERRTTNPPGRLVSVDKAPVIDPDIHVAKLFILGFCLSDGYLMYDVPLRHITDVNKTTTYNMRWYPDVPGTPMPAEGASELNTYPSEPYAWINDVYEAAWYYFKCKRTEGQSWKYCKYTLPDSGSTVVAVTGDGTDILNRATMFDGPYATAANARRGGPDVMYRKLVSAYDIWVFDPSRPKDSYENMILEPEPGKSITVSVQGSTLQLYNETFS